MAWRRQAVFGNYAEKMPVDCPERPWIRGYTDRLGVAAGRHIGLCVSTNAAFYRVEVLRDGATMESVWRSGALPGRWHPAPADCSVRGCGWPVAVWLQTDPGWQAGGYIVRLHTVDADQRDSSEHLFLLSAPPDADRSGRIALIAATGSWTAYNDWGGSNHYQGLCGATGDQFSPVLSLERPFARGFVSLPPDAPRALLREDPAPMAEPVYPHLEWAFRHGYSKKYASSGWASFERPFVQWAERQGLWVDPISHVDLHQRPDALAGYACAVMVGHDEYWSWEMRDAVDDFVSAGGRIARFAANFMWQIRLEDEGRRQVCHKYTACASDPLMQTGPRSRVTESWEAAGIGRPGRDSFGLDATHGIYAGWSGCSPRGARGFPVYRPDHWAFAGTGLYYGDILGGDSAIFGYEVDGLDYVISGGLPRPARPELYPDSYEILALGLASTLEEGPTILPGESFLGTEDAEYVAEVLTGAADATGIERTKRGSGAIVHFRKGRGEVFHAGTCDWVAGLARSDPMVEQVTRTVLRRFLDGSG